jgi:hypothetical protein
VKQFLDNKSWGQVLVYMIGIAATAGALVWQVRELRGEVITIRKEVSAAARAIDVLTRELEARVREADKDHKRYDATLTDHELRLRVLEQRRSDSGQ